MKHQTNHSYIFFLACMCTYYWGMAFKSVLFEQKCFTYITLCYIRYNCEPHPITSLISFLIFLINFNADLRS